MGVKGFANLFVVLFGVVAAQEYYEELHNGKYSTHFKQIPKKFEVRGANAQAQFAKQLKSIQDIAKSENLTLVYKVKVEVLKPYLNQNIKRAMLKKGKSKKYNVPLKKNSMKLSNFEMLLRKMAEESGHKAQKLENFYPALVTERQKMLPTRPPQMKYRPIISRVKTNYTKIVRPVKNREIVLTS